LRVFVEASVDSKSEGDGEKTAERDRSKLTDDDAGQNREHGKGGGMTHLVEMRHSRPQRLWSGVPRQMCERAEDAPVQNGGAHSQHASSRRGNRHDACHSKRCGKSAGSAAKSPARLYHNRERVDTLSLLRGIAFARLNFTGVANMPWSPCRFRYYPLVLVLLAAPAVWSVRADEPAPAATNAEDVFALFDGKTTDGWKVTNFAGAGEIKVTGGELIFEKGETLTGLTWKDAAKLPKDNYEITLLAKKIKGDDFFCGLTFPVRDSYASFIVGGWAGTVVGVSSINGLDASENETTIYRKFDHDKWYRIRVRVANDKLECWIDDEQTVEVDLKDKKISTRIESDASCPLGLSTFQVTAAFKDVKLTRLKRAK
jgi:hypothetical protein